MFDTYKFIQTIHSHNSLWETGSKDYMNVNIKRKSWAEVGMVMYSRWNDFEQLKKEQLEKTMKNSWRHIRDNYMRYLNQQKSGDSAKSRKKYVYADSLSFLQHSLIKRRTIRNIEDSESFRDAENYSMKDNEEVNMTSTDNYAENESQLTSEQPLTFKRTSSRVAERQSKNNYKPPSQTPFQSKLIDLLQVLEPNILQDPDNMMLLSFASRYKKLSEDQKIDFQMHMLIFFKNINKSKPSLINQPVLQDNYYQKPTTSTNYQPTQSFHQPEDYSQFGSQPHNFYQQL